MVMGPLLNSAGSAEWAAGEASQTVRLVCSVNGPLEVKYRDELPQHAALEVVYRRNHGIPMVRERYIQDKLHAALLAIVRRDLHPRSLIQIVVQALETCHDEEQSLFAEISESVNAACLALVDAGIPCSGLLAALSYQVLDNGSVLPLLSPPQRTARGTQPPKVASRHAVAFRFAQDEEPRLVLLESVGAVDDAALLELLARAQTDAGAVVEQLRAQIEAHI